MRYLRQFITLLILFWAMPAFATVQFFNADHPITGANSVDAILGDGSAGVYEALADGDTVQVITPDPDKDVCFYVLVDDSACGSTSTESPCPEFIKPETVGACTNCCWEFADIAAVSFTALSSSTPTIAYKDKEATAGDVNCRSFVNCTDVGDGTEDCDWTLECQIAGTPTNMIVADADGRVTVTNLSATSAIFVTPALGTPSAGVLTSCTGLPVTTGVTGILPTANGGTGIAFFTAAGPTVARTYTFPDEAATIARTDAAQTFTGVQTFSSTIVGNIDTATTAATVTTAAQPNITSVGTLTSLASTGDLTGTTLSRTLTTAEGVQDGGDDAAILTDGGESWPTDQYIGMTLYNVTDVSSCVVTDNDGTTMTCTLAGGTGNDWDDGDVWAVAPGPSQSGAIWYIGAATTILHPAIVHYTAMYYSTTAALVIVDPQSASMQFTLNGAPTGTNGEELDSESAAGDFICIHNASATVGRTLGRSGAWTDGGAS